MSTHILFHGISTYEVSGPLGRVLMDPFIDGNPAATVTDADIDAPDVIVLSHAAWDHMASAAPIAMRTGAPVVCGADTAALLLEQGVPEGQIRRTTVGIRVRFGDLVVSPVSCAHWSSARLADGSSVSGVPIGFVVEVEPGVPVYHFGDSAVSTEMSLIGRVHRPVVGLLGVTQPWSLVGPGAGEVCSGEMTPREAAIAADLLGVRYAVASHYEDVGHPDIAAFLAAVPAEDSTGERIGLALHPGQTLVIDGAQHRVED